MRRLRRPLSCVAALGLLALLAVPAWAQSNLGYERDRMKHMLDQVAKEIEKNFYDPNLHGLDWASMVAQTRQRIEQANSVSQMLTAIFTLVDKLQDSHTMFLPPPRPVRVRFGFEAKAFGDEIRIYEVKKKSAAASAGLQVGDQILFVNGYRAERKSFDLMMLYFRALRPVDTLQLEIARGGSSQKIALQGKVEQKPIINDLKHLENIYELIREAESETETFEVATHADGIGYLKLPSVTASQDFWSGLIEKIKGAKAVLVDLRGNPGGSVESLKAFMGHFEAEPAVAADFVGRKKTEPFKIKPRKPNLSGPLFVLVDSQSASAAEIFARHFQRTGRAKVIGDRTSGRVTSSKFQTLEMGADIVVLFGVQVAVARVVFPGGEELEKRGVAPDQSCIPTSEDLNKERDSCRAVALRMARKALGLAEEPPEEKPAPKKIEVQ